MSNANVPGFQPPAVEWLEVVPLDDIGPLQVEFGEDPPPAPDGLREHLFDPIAPNAAELAAWGEEEIPECKTYAILDAAVLPLLPELLETSDLTYRCLFTGKALEELGSNAPWLVELDPDARLTRQLMSSQDDGGYWELDAGLYLRSRQPFEQLWRHLRKFTRLQDEAGNWFFNRYWAPPLSTSLLQIGNSADLVQFISPLFPSGKQALRVIALSSHSSAVLSRIPGTNPPPPHEKPILTSDVARWMHHIRRVQQFEELIDIAVRHVAKEEKIDPVKTAAKMRSKRDKFFGMGFWRRDHLTMLCVWEAMLGPDFIESYGNGRVREILTTSSEDWIAINRISNYLEPPDEPTDLEIEAALQANELRKMVKD